MAEFEIIWQNLTREANMCANAGCVVVYCMYHNTHNEVHHIGHEHNGRRRSPVAVAWALQRYLIFAILSCVPDRQRTIRELKVGTTLIKSSEDGKWYIRHGPGDYKTGKTYGPRPALLLAPHFYPELEAFMHVWRHHLNPQHEYLFSMYV